MSLEDFQKRSAAISQSVDAHLKNMDTIIAESARTADVATHSEQIIDGIEQQFEKCTGLNKLDVSFLFTAVALQVARQFFLTSFPERLDDKTASQQAKGRAEEHSNRVHRYYNPSLEEIISNPVPFDANIGANGALAGGGRMGHRVTALGHDPILGLFVGTANIATSTLTNKDLQSYHIYTSNKRDYFRNNARTDKVFSKTGEKLLHEGIDGKTCVAASLLKEIIHLKSDLYTKNSLPLPIVSVINASLATQLADYGLDMANVVTVGKQATYAILVNTLIAMIHMLFYDESIGNRRLYEVKTRKILSYSNIIASTSNLLYVGGNTITGNAAAIQKLDIGGLLVTLYRITTDARTIRQIKREFLEQEFFAQIRGTEYDFL